MALRNASIPLGATLTPTGGTATTLSSLGQTLSELKTYLASAGVTQLTRTAVDFSTKQPKASITAPGGFTQGRSSFKMTRPKVLANTKRTLNGISVEISTDPETSAAENLDLRITACLLLLDSELDAFWLNQSVD